MCVCLCAVIMMLVKSLVCFTSGSRWIVLIGTLGSWFFLRWHH